MSCFYIENTEKNIYEFYTKEEKSVQFPQLVAVHRARGYHFKYFLPNTEKGSLKDWDTFLQECMNKKRKPVLRSLPEPAVQGGPVTVAVGTTFEELVMKSDVDVVVQMYSSYCDHCTKMMKRFEKVATFFKDNEKVRFVRFDASENMIDVEEIYVAPAVAV